MEVLPPPDRARHRAEQPGVAATPDQLTQGGGAPSQELPVYNLRLNQGCSDRYYADAARFTDLLLDEIEMRAGVLLDRCRRHMQEHLREAPRSRGEYALDLLVLGMAFRRYLDVVESSPGWAVELTREFLWLRRRSAALKPFADIARAILNSLFLSPKASSARGVDPPSLDKLPRLIEWLSASGEFTQEAMRLNNWRSCLALLPTAEAGRWFRECLAIFDWFASESKVTLGAYTQGVARFLEDEAPRHRCREDRILCSREAVEYHLAMVGAEIMNRGMQGPFLRTSKRIVLVPACMRVEHATKCRSRVMGFDMTCTGCNSECNVNRVTRRMRELGATVYLVPHSSGFSKWLARWQGNADIGVTAVACLANILSGGYEMRSRRIASQCVILDHPGCQKHWSRDGIATDLNESRLVQIVSRGMGADSHP